MVKKRSLQGIFEKLEESPYRSEAFKWLMKHHDAINNGRKVCSWKQIQRHLEAEGITDPQGKAYSTDYITKVWYRVKKAKVRDEAWKAGKLIHSNQTTSLSQNISSQTVSKPIPVSHIPPSVSESEKREEPSEELKQERRKKALEKFEAHFEKRDRLNNLNLG